MRAHWAQAMAAMPLGIVHRLLPLRVADEQPHCLLGMRTAPLA
jgi:hypothetical protein